VRQPLHKILLPILDDRRSRTQVEGVKELILSEVNVKDIEYVTDTVRHPQEEGQAQLQDPRPPPRQGYEGRCRRHRRLGQDEIARIEKKGNTICTSTATSYELTLEDFEITAEDIPGWQVPATTTSPSPSTSPSTTICWPKAWPATSSTASKTSARTRASNVTDRIRVALQRAEAVIPAVERFADYIKAETLTEELRLEELVAGGEEVELPGEVKVLIRVERG
jgi:isoleucyl-tRNA synthetase